MIDLKHTSIGIELGSTRIKSVLIDKNANILAQGNHAWENKYENNFWTYSLEDVINGLQSCFANLKEAFKQQYNQVLSTTGSIGISAMMHGYLVFDKNGKLLTPFRTWRNVNAEQASVILTDILDYHIPARWSIAHLYQAILNGEEHVKDIAFQTTLAGYVHYLLTGQKVIGVGEASGMFPINSKTKDYDKNRLNKFNSILKEKGFDFLLENILPRVLVAGDNAGQLTKDGALLLDPTGEFKEGVLFCPPEGDAETGMVATNTIKSGTGNISAGTSIFGMIVLKDNLKAVYPEIDLVATPLGEMVAMVHCNNCTSDINAWVNLFDETLSTFGMQVSKEELFDKLFKISLSGEDDCSDVIAINYLSGESITRIENGRPLVVRTTESKFSLANLIRSHLYSCFATLKIGIDILYSEGVKSENIAAHGGLFKTEGVAQKYLASILDSKVSVMKTAGEGGAWGMAILALFAQNNDNLQEFLDMIVFKNAEEIIEKPNNNIKVGFDKYLEKYRKVLEAESNLSEKL